MSRLLLLFVCLIWMTGSSEPSIYRIDFTGRQVSTFLGAFVVLVFGGNLVMDQPEVEVLPINPTMDAVGQAWQRFGLHQPDDPALVLVRPDGYVMGRWHGLDPAPLCAALNHVGVFA